MASSTKLWAGSQLLTTFYWVLAGWHLSGGSQPEFSSPEETYGTPEKVLSWHSWKTELLGPGRWLRCMAHLGWCICQALGPLSCSDLGRAQNACPTHRDRARTVSEYLLWRWSSAGSGAPGAADLDMVLVLLEEVAINAIIEPPELTQDWGNRLL